MTIWLRSNTFCKSKFYFHYKLSDFAQPQFTFRYNLLKTR